MKLFFDTNVLLDVLGRREPHYAQASAVWSGVERGVHQGYVSAISFNNVYYILERAAGRKTAREAMKLMRDIFRVVPLDEQMLHCGIDSEFPDLEDAIQYFCAVRAGADCILTRDVRHFPAEAIPALTPEEFLAADAR